METLRDLTITSFREKLTSKAFSALEITQAFFKYIKEHDKEIGSYLSLSEETAIREAEAVDIALRDETVELGPLAGVPLAIKDNILIKGLPATAASKILERYVGSYDAHVIQNLKKEKAIFLGKTNLDEFAMGSSTENSAFHITKNPHDLSRVPGGSSGGSAAAVAAHLAVAALGSDTGGSIREPASFCGVVGLKPTYGAVSRSGLISMASSLDQIGPLTKTVEDAALLFSAIHGKDPLDATSAEVRYGEELLSPDFQKVKKFVVGLPEEYFTTPDFARAKSSGQVSGLDPSVQNAMDQTIKDLESLGVTFKKISLPHTTYALSTYYIIMDAEVSSNLARFDGIRYARLPEEIQTLKDIYLKQRSKGFGAEPKRRIILGTFVLSSGYYDAYYEKAERVRALIKKDFEDAFQNVDMLLTPVTPTSAFKIGEKVDDPLAMYLSDIFTVTVNLAGLPAISIPVRDVSWLPIGFQLIGKAFHEPDILGLGYYYEKLGRA